MLEVRRKIIDDENPNFTHKIEQIHSTSKIPAMRFLGVFLPPT
jgi:hypothetical protein